MTEIKLVLFDMDGTLIKDRGIFVIAEKKGFLDELIRLIKDEKLKFYERSIEIAKLSKDYKVDEYFEIFRKIPFQDNLKDVIKELKNKNIITAIATDSYQFLADDVKERLGLDYAFANNLIIKNGVITGDLEIHNTKLKEELINNKVYSICKSCVLETLCERLDIDTTQAIAIGDGIVDIGMIKKAGIGIAFNASEEVQKHADLVTNDMKILLDYI